MRDTIARIEAVKDLIQEAVDKGATSVEQIHKTIAELPLSALEKRGLLGEEGSKALGALDASIGTVYEAIRSVNREIGELASGLFEALENHVDAREKLADPKRSAEE